jgi:hypothetical protein
MIKNMKNIQKIKELAKEFFKKHNITKESWVAILLVAVSFLGFYFWGNKFTGGVWIGVVIVFAIIVFIISLFAGFAVVKSLFFLSGEISLLIFLAQSYCDVPVRSENSDNALKSLLVIGFLYIFIEFVRSIFKAVKTDYKIVKKDKWSKEKVITIFAYLFFIVAFLWQVYLVVFPIVNNICVYK